MFSGDPEAGTEVELDHLGFFARLCRDFISRIWHTSHTKQIRRVQSVLFLLGHTAYDWNR